MEEEMKSKDYNDQDFGIEPCHNMSPKSVAVLVNLN